MMIVSAYKLQSFWRKQVSIRKLAKQLLECMGRDMAFEKLVEFLKDHTVLAIATNCLKRILPRNPESPAVSVAVFLSAVFIDRFPDKVLDSMHDNIALVESATRMIRSFSTLLRKIVMERAFPSTDEFVRDLNAYLPLFESWRVIDLARVPERIRNAIRVTEIALTVADEDFSVSAEMVQQLEDNLVKLREKLLKFA